LLPHERSFNALRHFIALKPETYEAMLPIVSKDEIGVAYTHRF